MRSRRTRRRTLAVLTLLGSAALLTGCVSGSSPTAAPGTSPSSSTTTTTLPPSIGIAQTQLSGALGFLGPVLRVSVVNPAVGAAVLPPAPPGLGASQPSIRIAYRKFGAGPNLLLVMGERGTMTWWDPALLQALAQKFTVTIFDLPGVGYSAPAEGKISLAEEGDVTAGLVLSLGLELEQGVTILGWGTGGDVALAAVERHPKVATGLVLVDTPAPGALEDQAGSVVRAAFASTWSTVTGLSRFLFPPSATAARSEWVQRIAQLPPDDETARSVSVQASLAASVATDRALASGLPRLGVPVLVMTGSEDQVAPAPNATALHRAIPDSRLVVLAHAGYDALVSDQAQVLSSLTAPAG